MGSSISHHLLFLRSAVLVYLTESVGDDEAGLYAFDTTIADGLKDWRCWDGDDGQIHWSRDSAHHRIGRVTEHRLCPPIDRIHCPWETFMQQLAKQPVPP